MKNVMFLSSGHCGSVTANGSCVRSLVDAVQAQGNNTWVISYDEADGSTEAGVISVCYQPNNEMSDNPVVRYAKIAWSLARQAVKPETDRQLTVRLFNEADSICSRENVHAVVAPFFARFYPVELIEVGRMLKKKYPQVCFIIYELDSVADGIAANSKWRWLTSPAYERYLKKVYAEADAIILMKSHEQYWKAQFGRFENKLRMADIPVLVPRKLPVALKNDEKIRFLYGGLLDYDYRSPEKLIRAFCEIGNQIDWQIDFYSKGCDDLLSSAQRANERFVRHGYVRPDVLEHAIAQADVLISIGNKVSNSVPSKTISYMGYGKPIIHFSLQENDVCANYLQNYPLALMIAANEPASDVAQRIHAFIRRNTGESVPYDVVSKAMPWNTPEYSAGVILDLIK